MHPILLNRKNLLLYALAWIFIMAVQAGVLVYYFNLDKGPALADSIVFNLIFSVTGLLMWYPVRYMPLSGRRTVTVYLNFTALGIVVVGVWLASGYLIMRQLFFDDEAVIRSVAGSVPYRVVFGVLLYVMVLLVYYLIVYSRNLAEKAGNEARLETMVKEAELNMLKSQINPHFMFNALNSASALTLSDPAAAREMIIRLSEFLRYSLKLADSEINPLKDEIANVQRYLEIEKVRFGSRMKFEIDTGEGCENRPVPYLILQPLVENAIKHGVYESTGTVTISMKCRIEGDMLAIRISNDFDSGSPARSGAGIGLKNVRERMRLFYGRDDLLLSRKEDGMFVANLFIPNNEDKSVDS
ncbi:MAG: hypothetical protein EA408_05605 [Marinilabiliales bacterium]|nr:MAG: hypothetical protein EA408_05605 [Marinilabiliales bacterium]